MKVLLGMLLVTSVIVSAYCESPDEKLIASIKASNQNALKQALAEGANVNLADANGTTVLMLAITFGQTENVKTLLEKGADISMEDIRGNNALFIASMNHRNEIVKMLLLKGADINAKNKQGQTCLTAALNKRLPDTAKIIMESGAPFAFNSALLNAALRCRNEEMLLMIRKKSVHEPKDEKTIDKLLERIRENNRKREALKKPVQPEKGYAKYFSKPLFTALPLFIIALSCISIIVIKKMVLKNKKKT
ncbi:MAG: hypothetical protein A2017_02010 [Lentisphaerae bacterium GWF2_44_16]|nr:MAG: hypothetical protein A2017_02010 [Lentisphaerae bacterium GWF2_44_16]